MFITTVRIGKSPIDGQGVFALVTIPAGKTIWKYADGHDIAMYASEFENLPDNIKLKMGQTGFYSTVSDRWIFPPKGDAAQFLNHSSRANLTAIYDLSASEEAFFVTNRTVQSGEELTTNYYHYNKAVQITRPGWAEPSSKNNV